MGTRVGIVQGLEGLASPLAAARGQRLQKRGQVPLPAAGFHLPTRRDSVLGAAPRAAEERLLEKSRSVSPVLLKFWWCWGRSSSQGGVDKAPNGTGPSPPASPRERLALRLVTVTVTAAGSDGEEHPHCTGLCQPLSNEVCVDVTKRRVLGLKFAWNMRNATKSLLSIL